MARKKRLRSSRPLDQELPQPKDPLSSLPNTCVYAILEHFTTVELIGMRRVSRSWRGTIDWRLAGIMRKCRPELEEGVDEEEATSAFRRDIFRQQARNDGKPAFVRIFTHATQGFAMCGDYFCWVDNTCLNIQPVFNSNKSGPFAPVRRYRLTRLLNAKSLSVDTIKPQEVGSVTDRPLLMIKTAVICVKSGTVLWSTAPDDEPLCYSTLRGKQLPLTLNHAAFAHLAYCYHSRKPILHVRDVLTGEIKAAKPIPDEFPFSLTEDISVQLHPRRDLVYIATCKEVFFFSTATASCVGRLSVATITSAGAAQYQDYPPILCFSEHRPKCDPLSREKFLLCKYKTGTPSILCYCFEYEVPTDEDISTSEARILQDGNLGSEENLVFKALRIQIYEQRGWGNRTGPFGINPMLKQAAQTEIAWVRGKEYTRVRFHFFAEHRPVPVSAVSIFLERGKRHDGSIPAEFYQRNGREVLVSKPKKTPAHARRHNERVDCLLRKPFPFLSPITLTEKYMLLTHQSHVYLFAFEPRW